MAYPSRMNTVDDTEALSFSAPMREVSQTAVSPVQRVSTQWVQEETAFELPAVNIPEIPEVDSGQVIQTTSTNQQSDQNSQNIAQEPTPFWRGETRFGDYVIPFPPIITYGGLAVIAYFLYQSFSGKR
jgi:hypothetical protein